MGYQFEIQADALGPDVALVAFRGSEGLSRTFAVDVFVTLLPDAVPSADAVIGQPVTLTVIGGVDTAAPQMTHGHIGEFRVIDEAQERSLIAMQLRPKLWELGLSRHSRVFTEMKVSDIIAEVLDRGGVSHELRLNGAYEIEAHISQYKESDLSFLQRLMEHEGIYYFFEHQSGDHKMIVCDDKSAHDKSRTTPLRYHPVHGGDLGADLFETFKERRRMRPAKLTLTDYDYGNPSLSIESSDQVDQAGSTAQQVTHNGRAFTPAQAKRINAVRKQEQLAGQRTFEAHGSAFHLRAGATFDLASHHRLSGGYLCVEHRFVANLGARTVELAQLIGVDANDVYEAHVRCIADDVQYRPPRVTAKPRIFGLDRALIEGPADSDYAQLDDDGRYRVKLGFDESDNAGERASVRTRMMQPHAGSPEGWHMPLRKDTEVLVAFLNGDPDRPIVAGAVPNANTPSVVTSANHTRNVFHSGGDNTIVIEDEDGSQWVVVRSPTQDSYLHLGSPHGATQHSPPSPTHHVELHTDADCRFEIGGDQDINVGGKLTEDVTGDVTEVYKTSQKSEVTADQSTVVVGDVTEKYKSGHKTTVTDKVTEVYVAGQKSTVKGLRSELYDTTQNTMVVGGATHTYDSQESSVLGGPSTQSYIGGKTLKVAGATEFTFDSSVTQLFGPTTLISPSSDWTVKGGCGIITPSWNSVFVNLGNIMATTNRTGGVTKTISVGIESMVLKYELVATVAAGACGAKIEPTACVAEAYTGKLTLTGILIAPSGAKLHAQPLKVWG